MDVGGYIDFLVGRSRVEISFVILLVSIATELLFLLLICKPKHKGKTVTVLSVANIINLFLTECVFKIIYGAWFISIDAHSFQNFFVRLVLSLVVVVIGGILFLKKEYTEQKKFIIVLVVSTGLAAVFSLGVEVLFRIF